MPPTKRIATEGRKRVRRRNDDDEDASQGNISGSYRDDQAVQLHERINQRGRQARICKHKYPKQIAKISPTATDGLTNKWVNTHIHVEICSSITRVSNICTSTFIKDPT